MANGSFILPSEVQSRGGSGQRGGLGIVHGHGDCATGRMELGCCGAVDDRVPKTRPLGKLSSVGRHMSRAFLMSGRMQAQEIIQDPAIRGALDKISKPECAFVENCNVGGGAVCTGGLVTPSASGEHAFRRGFEREAGSKLVLKRRGNEEASQIGELGPQICEENIVHRALSDEENFILGVPEPTDALPERELDRKIGSTWRQNFHEKHNVSRTNAECKSEADSGHPTCSASTSHDASSTTKLRVVPSPPGSFDSLNTINLSARGIVRITPGTLPKRLHVLDLSHNEIGRIQGFRELTHLRVLNLSHNRISRIGHSLSNCTRIKELYFASNKICKLEGFHRLRKLRVLDLSFNHLATPKCLGQLAANYSSLIALNVLGNALLTNLGDEQLLKMVTSVLPNVNFLNKQPIKAMCLEDKEK